jgi:hypothetical protein
MLPALIPSNALPALPPQADALLSVDGGAIMTLAAFVVLALAMVFGVAGELRRTAAPSTVAPVRFPGPATPRALAA